MRYTILKGQTYSSLNLTQFTLLIICSFLLAFSFPALAKPDKDKPEKVKKPVISEVFVDTSVENPVTQIIGNDFDNPSVSLGIQGPLTVTYWDEGLIEVETPVVPDGDYKLTVRQGDKGKKKAEFDLTIGSGGGGAEGPQGPAGPQGEQGEPGIQGPPGEDGTSGGGGGGVTGWEIVETTQTISNQSLTQFTTPVCPDGKVAMSGGAGPASPPFSGVRAHLVYSYPNGSNWRVGVENTSGVSKNWKRYTVCATGTP